MKLTLSLGAMFLLNGCAFMFNGGKQDVSFETNPSDADIKNNGKFVGTGQAVVSIDRSTSQNILVSSEGYDDQHVYLQKKMNAPWLIWDIGTCVFPIALCIPVLVDAISGAWNGYEDHYAVKLTKSTPQNHPSVSASPPASAPPPNNNNPSNTNIIIVK